MEDRPPMTVGERVGMGAIIAVLLWIAVVCIWTLVKLH
jgi:hypothetical protein